MNDYLKSYHMQLTALGPVFIGNGKEIGKKEYIFRSQKEVAIVDIEKLYTVLSEKGKADAFEQFVLANAKEDLGQWLEHNHIRETEIKQLERYVLKNADIMLERGSRSKLQILEFVKDAYHMPYVPGSSIKGMLRTILLASDIVQNQKKYTQNQQDIRRGLANGRNRRTLLAKETKGLESDCYHMLHRNEKRKEDAVNDILSGLVVSDSRPLTINDLTLCQRVERRVNGEEKTLNVLRECLKPGTQISFDITIDTKICPLSIEDIMQAVARFNEVYYTCFLSKFKGMDRPKNHQVYLGGGTGFVTKTEVYPLFGEENGVEMTKEIFAKTGVPAVHKHMNDHRLGVSPHIVKCTHYKGQTVQMGMCLLAVNDT